MEALWYLGFGESLSLISFSFFFKNLSMCCCVVECSVRAIWNSNIFFFFPKNWVPNFLYRLLISKYALMKLFINTICSWKKNERNMYFQKLNLWNCTVGWLCQFRSFVKNTHENNLWSYMNWSSSLSSRPPQLPSQGL